MLEASKEVKGLMEYLPDERELHLLPRQWLANVCYTVCGQSFKDWVTILINARHEKFKHKNNLMIEMDPEIAKALEDSNMVSSKYRLCLRHRKPFATLR